MQTPLTQTARCFPAAPAVLIALGLLLTGGQAAQAQAGLSLVQTSLFGSTATFAVNLTGGADLSGFDFNILIDPAFLSFAGTSPFTSSPGNPFDTPLADTLSGPNDLRVSYGQFGPAAITNAGTTSLGTFQVITLQPLPAAGTALSFGAIGVPDAPTNGSQVYDAAGNNVLSSVTGAVLTPATPVPETSSVISLGLLLGLGAFCVSRRRRPAAN